jgi:hypothetical protein
MISINNKDSNTTAHHKCLIIRDLITTITKTRSVDPVTRIVMKEEASMIIKIEVMIEIGDKEVQVIIREIDNMKGRGVEIGLMLLKK